MKNSVLLKFLVPVFFLFALASCDTEDEWNSDASYDSLLEDIESLDLRGYTEDLAEMDLDEEWEPRMHHYRGKVKCFEFVFPVTLIYPDGIEVVVDDRESLREYIHQWKEENPDAVEKPEFAYPFDVILRDSTELTIADEAAFEALKEECHINRPPMPLFKLCFTPVFPITLAFPDGTTLEVGDVEAMKTALHDWKLANPDATEKPEIVFPISIEWEDGTIVEVASFDDLKEQLKDCVEKMKKKNKKHGPKFGGKGGK